MPDSTIRKKEGFKGQKAIVIPRSVLSRKCAPHDIAGNLYITDIGYYPKAEFHYRERAAGADQHILIYSHKGSGRLHINGIQYEIGPGNFFVIPANVPHTYAADIVLPWTIYWLHFKGKTSDAMVDMIVKKHEGNIGFIRFSDDIINLFNEMYAKLELGYSTDQLVYANMCLWHFLSAFIFSAQYIPGEKPALKGTIERAIDYLSLHKHETLTLRDIASSVNLSASHFSQLFNQKTGFSPIEYLNHLKIQSACQYLLFTDMRIKQIAVEIGFSDQYYFSRLFRKIMGQSPAQYRKK